ncbi:hypothetical protein ElyMa_006533900 [Elysia marginata]|uniref:Uncharacterized protein n=1 Tax=Elysia marginata TaxID=1093978 RepID=A0AAV4I6N3_9GAST|nr:hypothetical protein ElyMa_006533900 [Elysia marginata]
MGGEVKKNNRNDCLNKSAGHRIQLFRSRSRSEAATTARPNRAMRSNKTGDDIKAHRATRPNDSHQAMRPCDAHRERASRGSRFSSCRVCGGNDSQIWRADPSSTNWTSYSGIV